jgi:hypothetical protein
MRLFAWLLCLTGPCYVMPFFHAHQTGYGYLALAVQLLALLVTVWPERAPERVKR